MIQARKRRHSVRLLNPISLAFATDLSQATSMQFTVLSRQADCAGLFFNQIISPRVQISVVFCSIIGGQSASLSNSCRVSIQSSQPPVHSVYKFRFQRLDNEFSDIPQFILLPVGVFCTFFTKINPFLTMKQLYLLDKALRNQAVGVTKVPV